MFEQYNIKLEKKTNIYDMCMFQIFVYALQKAKHMIFNKFLPHSPAFVMILRQIESYFLQLWKIQRLTKTYFPKFWKAQKYTESLFQLRPMRV